MQWGIKNIKKWNNREVSFLKRVAGMPSRMYEGVVMPEKTHHSILAVDLLQNLVATAPTGRRLLGVDLGSKTIGLSVCDSLWQIATPLEIIRRGRFFEDMKSLGRIISDYEIGGFVFGWPLHMGGDAGAACDRVRSFIDEMKNHDEVLGISQWKTVWVALWDERLSTQAVHSFLVETVDMSRTKRAQIVDKLAAQIILQGAIDFMARQKSSS